MSEEQAALVDDAVPTTDDSDADFEAGFSDSAPTETPEPEAEPSEEPVAQEPEPQPEPEPEPEPEETLTAADIRELKARAAELDTLKRDRDRAFGTIGELKQHIRDLSARRAKIEVTDEDVASIVEEYPELGGKVKDTLAKIFSKLDAQPVAQPAPAAEAPKSEPQAKPLDEEAIVKKAATRLATEALDLTHEGWREVIGMRDANGVVPKTEFRQWLATQPPEYAKRVGDSFSHVVIGKAIDDFKAAKSKQQATDNSRRQRIAAAVTPKGSGNAPATRANDEDDAFNEGFKSG